MVNSYYHVLGHVAAAVFAAKNSGDLVAALAKGGFDKGQVARGEELVSEAEKLVRRKVDEVGEDRIREHAIHAAAAEVEMWLQAAESKLRRADADDTVLELVKARKLHTHDHTTTVIAKALRTITIFRCDPRVLEALGSADAIRSVINRGHALLKKLYASTDLRLAPEGREGELAIFDELFTQRVKLEEWLRSLDSGVAAVAQKDLRLLGRLGYAPNEIGVPVGGTSYAVILHERGQTRPPDPRNVTDCPGWSAGRQGRNSENLGKGWIGANFEG